MSNHDALSDRIHDARTRARLSMRQLTAQAGLGNGHVSLLESGRRIDPSMSTVVALARALGVTVDWLATGEGPRRRRSR